MGQTWKFGLALLLGLSLPACSSVAPRTANAARLDSAVCSRLRIDTVNAAENLLLLQGRVGQPVAHSGSRTVARDAKPLARFDNRVYRDAMMVASRLKAWEGRLGHNVRSIRRLTLGSIEELARSCGATHWGGTAQEPHRALLP